MMRSANDATGSTPAGCRGSAAPRCRSAAGAFCDGGLAESIPYRTAVALGATHVHRPGRRWSLVGALSPPGEQLEHGMSHDEVGHCTLQHTRAFARAGPRTRDGPSASAAQARDSTPCETFATSPGTIGNETRRRAK